MATNTEQPRWKPRILAPSDALLLEPDKAKLAGLKAARKGVTVAATETDRAIKITERTFKKLIGTR